MPTAVPLEGSQPTFAITRVPADALSFIDDARHDPDLISGGIDTLTDLEIYKFWVGNNRDNEKAIEKLKATLEWRDSFNFASIATEDFSDIHESGKLYPLPSPSREGHTILIWRMRLHVPDPPNLQRMVRYIIYMTYFRWKLGLASDKLVIVACRDTVEAKNRDLVMAKQLAVIFSANFPETLVSLYLFPNHWIVSGLWAMVRPFLDPLTASKELNELTTPDNLPVSFGGTWKGESPGLDPELLIKGEKKEMPPVDVTELNSAHSAIAAINDNRHARPQPSHSPKGTPPVNHQSTAIMGAGPNNTNFHTEFRVPHVSRYHRAAATTMGAVMWFWMMYRAKQSSNAALAITDFRFDLSAPLAALHSIHSSNSRVSDLAAALSTNAAVPDRHAKLAILNGLSLALLDPLLTEDILRLFRPLVIDLVARLVNKTPEPETPSYSPDASKPGKRRRTQQEVDEASLVPDDDSSMDIDTPVLSSHDLSTHELTCIALAKLVLVAPQIKPLVVQYFASHPSPVDRLIRLSATSSPSSLSDVTATRASLGLVPLRAIALDPATPAAVRIPAAHVVAEYLRLTDADRSRFLDTSSKHVPESKYKMFALEQAAYVQRLQSGLGSEIPQADGDAWVVTGDHLTSNVVDVCGILLTTSPAPASLSRRPCLIANGLDSNSHHAPNLFSISLALSLGAPSCSKASPGRAKPPHRLACRSFAPPCHKDPFGRPIRRQIAAGHVRGHIHPGPIQMVAGVLTRAVEDGHWLVLEDMDLASKDVISVLVPLLEKRKVYVAQRGQEGGAAQGLGAGLWTHVQVKALPRDELAHVLTRRFPRLARLAPVMLDAFERVAAVYHDPANRSSYKSGGRYMSTRDLIKWCKRADRYVRPGDALEYASVVRDENVTEPLMREAIDVFVCMIPSMELRRRVVEVLGEALDVGEVKGAGWSTTDEAKFHAGRASLTITRTASLRSTGHSHPFATTAHAKRLLERIAVAVDFAEPVLLVGETGTGKTTVVQHLARPANVAAMVAPLIEEFYPLFGATFSVKKNAKFLDLVKRAQVKSKYEGLVTLFAQACKMAADRFDKHDASAAAADDGMAADAKAPSKKVAADPTLRAEWKDFALRVDEVKGMVSAANKLFFSFVEGTLVSAIRKGEWVLLDEVNLASGETLESLSGLLEEHGSLLLTERGDEQVVPRHAEFRLFACMNPATDVGKRDLPIGLRNRFSEVYVESPDAYLEDLTLIVKSYLDGVAHADPSVVDHVVQLYLEAKRLAESVLYDGAGTRPHFSLRTLSRALSFASTVAPMYGVRRALYEGFAMTFVTLLDVASQATLEAVMDSVLCAGKAKHVLAKSTPAPANTDAYVQFGAYWLPRGPYEPPEAEQAKRAAYVMTPSVQRNLGNLARAVMTVRYPVLIQGPTSSGKTSMIEHLAHVTHHKFVRINNHEHTDLQEYLGCYVSDDQGKLVFKEGALVTALKEGHWIVLDELNLAPTDVLEALNRLLDDNRELFIPETQQVVRPHPHFMLFATQNPPSYGGRKVLSRAFRNRFLELHFDDLPDDELHTILAGRCKIAPSYAKAIIAVYQELRRRRQESRLFDGKSSFITLRDLFRWANRPATNYQTLAENGWMILGERVRSHVERRLVVDVLQGMKKGIVIDPLALYERIFAQFQDRIAQLEHLSASIVWNKTMKRLFSLVVSCIANQEPILLVGETGCGKTTVCQVIAELEARQLVIVNCHQHSETSDFIGSQRPAREHHHQHHHHSEQQQQDIEVDHKDKSTENNKAKLFEWQDGPLVQAMKQGHYFLLDEVSLADDSVLERLNSVLEPSRALLIAEKGGDVEQVTAVDAFRFLATMNPGGDYGKKELSPALRNRFTEIWTDQVEDYHDLHEIVAAKLKGDTQTATAILDYVTWFKEACRHDHIGVVISMRDLIAWAEFVMASRETLGTANAFLHGGCMVLLDGIKSTTFAAKCLAELEAKAGAQVQAMTQVVAEGVFGIGAFTIPLGAHPVSAARHTLNAPTSRENLLRVLRALQIPSKAILLEGSPGVGKTSLVSALAHLSGHKLVRINLSEQTDLIDLFGSDLPVEGGQAGEFAWRDGPFLSAMKAGDWVLLDELNLASQSVLEGLNACLDHRGSVYLPELDRSFDKHPDFRIFGAQNPLEEGGGRRGLPKSFLNRFTQVHVRALTDEDLMIIVNDMYPNVAASSSVVQQMLEFNSQLHHTTMVTREFGMAGSPWEFNLRDVLRWLELMEKTGVSDPATFLDVLYLQRMQTDADRVKTLQLWNQVTGSHAVPSNPALQVTSDGVELGLAHISRLADHGPIDEVPPHVLVPHTMLRPLQALLTSIQAGWMSMVVGPSGCGKTALVRTAAALTGHPLVEFAMNSSVDALELLGGFEQVDRNRCLEQLTRTLSARSSALLARFAHDGSSLDADALAQLSAYQRVAATQLSEDQLQHWIDLIAYASGAAASVTGTNPDAERESHMHLLAKYKQLSSTAGKFEWVDGVLLDAVQNGKWLLLDNANLCSPSVLDRLNPLFEASLHRHLLINERGQTQDGKFVMVEPHPNFRMFMTLDPKFGQISRAMRNRGIEVALVDSQWMHDPYLLTQLLEVKGVQEPVLRTEMLTRFTRHASREFVMAVDHTLDLLQRGFRASHAVAFVAHHSQVHHLHDHAPECVPEQLVPHPPLLLQHSEPSLMHAKTSYLSSPLTPVDHLEVAMDCLVEQPDLTHWKQWLHVWIDWCRDSSIAVPGPRVDTDRLLQLVDRMSSHISQLPAGHHVLVRCVLQYTKLKLAQEQVFSQTGSLKLSKMNMIQRSHCAHAFPHRLSSVEASPTLAALYPTLLALEKGVINAVASFEDAMLHVLLWSWSLWNQCLVASEINLDLLDAHVSQLLEATNDSVAFSNLHVQLRQLQLTYAGDMEASQAVWLRLHPWAVRTADLYEPVMDMLNIDRGCLPADLCNLTVDALTNVFLGDASQQALLLDDLPRLLQIIAPFRSKATAADPAPVDAAPANEEDCNNLLVVGGGDEDDLASIRLLVSQGEQTEAARSAALQKWVWSASVVQVIAHAAHRADMDLPPTCARFSESHAPSLAELVHFRLLQWSLSNSSAVERSWNMVYVDLRRVLYDQPLWQPRPTLLSSELVAACDHASVIDMDATIQRLKLLQLDLAVLERDLLAARIQLLQGMPVHQPLGLAFMESAIPTSPLDPATRFSLVHHYTKKLESTLQLELQEVQETSRQLYLRPANANEQLKQLFGEFRSLLSSLTNEQSFLTQLVQGSILSVQRADSIAVVQRTLNMFVSRTSANYPLFMDLLEPVYSGIHDVLHGLRLVAMSHAQDSAELVQLAALPAIRPASLQSLIDFACSPDNTQGTVLPLVDVLLERFQQKRDEDNRRRKEQDATFKEEIDWFKLEDDPFTAGLKRESGLNGEAAEDGAGPTIKQRERQASERFSSLVYRAFTVYQELFGNWSSAHRLESIPAQDHCAPRSSGLTHIVAMLANHKRMTNPVDETKYDFYRHANLKEVARLKNILLVTVAHRLAEFPAAMPLIKFVQSLEYLLEKCDEWEKFAAKHVSIREHMDAISSLIIDWRRLELFNWANLLDYFDAQEKKEGSPWWLHLYSVLVYASGINSQDLVSSLDEFIMSSTVGQLELRLEILAALNRHFKVEVLANTHDYYAQFVPHVKQHISKQRVEIEKELKDQFKIASWKDVNVYALKQSAQRTHRQLNKCLRKYRLVLQEPLLSLIGQKSDGVQAIVRHSRWVASRDAKLGVILSKSRQLSALVAPMPLPLVDFTQELIEGIREFKKETDSITDKLAKHESTTMLQIRKKAYPICSSKSQLTFAPLVDAAKSYHLRMIALMQSMPEMMGQRSEDIQVNQAERALGYATDFFKLATTERRHLTPALNELAQLATLANHLETMTNASSVPSTFAQQSTVSSEILTQSTLAIMCQRVTTLNILSSNAKTAVEDMCATVLGFIRRFRATYPDSKVELHDAELLQEWATAKETARQDLLELARECPRDAIILRGIVEYLEPQSANVQVDDGTVTVEEIVTAGQQVIEAIMVQLQHLYQFNSHLASLAANDATATADSASSDLKVKAIHAAVVELLSKLASSPSVTQLVAVSPLTRPWRCLSHNQPLVWHQVKRVAPLVSNLAAAMHSTLFNVVQHHKTLAKAGYVVLINMTKLVRQGFCVPQSSDGDDDNAAGGQGDGQFEEADGTGIGQGSGNKDVSDEIEDEEQVLGLKDEEDQADESGDQERKENKKDEGMEMENDFDGDLEDLNLDGDEKQDQMPESADEEEEEGDDPDEAMDQVDNPEDHKVDESLWQDDEEQELREADDLENEKPEQQQLDQDDVDMNYEGHMDEDQDSPDADDKPPKDQKAQQQPEEVDQAESGEQQDEQDEDTLAEGELDGAESDDEDVSDPMDVDAEDDAKAQGAQEEEEEEQQEAAEGQEAKDEDKAMGPEDDESPEDESREVDMGMDESYDQQQDEQDSDGADDPDAADPMDVDQPEEVPPQDQEAAGVPESSAADAVQEEEEQEKDAADQSEDQTVKVGLSNRDDGQDDAAERTEDMAERGGQTEQEHADSNATAQDQQDPSSGREEEQRKSLGDAIREWRERLNMVERQQQQQQQQPESQGQEEDDKANYDQDEYEYVQEDDTDPSNEQTLGAAVKDQQMTLPPMPEEDEDEKDEAGDQDEFNADDANRQIQPDQSTGAMNQRDTDTSRDRNSHDMDTDETPYQVQPDGGAANGFDNEDELTEEAEAELRAEIAQDLAHHRRQPGQPAPELWHKYKAVTHHLALQLTEQLRLILEPTQAAKLTGDYKTGKRLNMKKIIPYIASDFKKDKIWLRRTKPSKRTYNVMLAVDDSESMADSQSVTLAFEAMAVLARAMSQLEVGQLAVAAFGEQVELVHPFERPFSDDAGAQALGQFTFAQQRTKVVKLLESAIQAFDQASLAASGTGEAWHLLLVLSDGVCEDHDKIRNLVRRAAERRVLVAFIVLDQKPEAESIMKMTSVAFEGGKVVMRRYMETFPFDFYIVLRDVSSFS
ncbi:hypothetical protein BCR44DRAFT_1497173 [Catenaria anguillulae PL171]|uniref:Midasin n=1 Tax=Catenaria anguillulae PL171 TaxID=765915 RepID=A0A1Y2HXV5_9FUNG|nr:hypothetical protein BCR44DRAFT_1497173 [Catenaria anguillulae PL171]